MAILQQIKSKSWNNKLELDAKGIKPLSTYKITNAITKPKDWDAIATKCSKNPNHEHFGKKPDEIRDIWGSKGKKGASRGNFLDTAITHTLATGNVLGVTSDDTKLINKYKQFMIFYEQHLKDIAYVGSEIWLTSSKGINCRLDALFQHYHEKTASDYLLIFDWKNNENISFDNRYQSFIGPAAHLDECDANKFTIQTQIYQYILSEDFGYKVSGTRVGQILEDMMVIHKPAFKYEKSFIEELLDFAKQNQQISG